jgi:hypothetical protein
MTESVPLALGHSPLGAGAPYEEGRPLWATAMYAGVRSGELRALRADSP